MNKNFDVIIIGAGPAGSIAAEELSKAKFKVLILEKEKLPRNKVCAGIAPPRIFQFFNDIPKEVIERKFKGYHLFSPLGIEVKSKFLREGLILNRTKFDFWLTEKAKNAGAKIGDNLKVIDINHLDFNYKILIGADGANSIVRKSIGIKYDADCFALGVQYTIQMENKLIDKLIGNWFEVHYGVVNQGYGWVSPLDNKIKIGIGSTNHEFKKDPKKYLNNFVEKFKEKKEIKRLEIIDIDSHLIPAGGPVSKPCSGSVLLAGDAAGFVYPLTGEGIYYAMKSGKVAADAVIKFLNNETENLETAYVSELRKKGLINLNTKLRDEILSSSEAMENYVMRLKKLEK